ncbi:RloB family protein [Bacteroides sp. UBA939]|uniref:RloB family protein n=1 Tax=Bacteroides sp. UBA939 TaxID=1946092 RepID=UPI0025B8024C|nr:RloB domain-containing protein [Bacteroides sp. UBA939]
MKRYKHSQNTRQVIHIIGEGLTGLFYFSHIKKLLGYRCSISPRLFENNSIEKIEKKLIELLKEDVFVICVFDADVSQRSSAESKKLLSLKRRYDKNKNVLLCDSMQSIEYWFLLHYEDTCRYFNDSAATEQALKRYIPTYEKSRKFMEKEKWVKDMIADGKMENACELAERYDERDSYSKIYKAIRILVREVSL